MKLLVDNGAATGGVLVGDTFEVATDAGFATLVVSKSLPQSRVGRPRCCSIRCHPPRTRESRHFNERRTRLRRRQSSCLNFRY
jgi:hypothetical protein